MSDPDRDLPTSVLDPCTVVRSIQITKICLRGYDTTKTADENIELTHQSDYVPSNYLRVLDMAFFDDETLCLRIERPNGKYYGKSFIYIFSIWLPILTN
jgi:hypothetical protein